MLGRLIRHLADRDAQARLAEARRENERLEGHVSILKDQIKRLLDWQARETARLETETAILTARKVAALDMRGKLEDDLSGE